MSEQSVEKDVTQALLDAAQWLDDDDTFPPPTAETHPLGGKGLWVDGWERGVVDAVAFLRERAADPTRVTPPDDGRA
jgi:hypothetical protein